MTPTLLATARSAETLVPYLVNGPDVVLDTLCDVDALAARVCETGDGFRPAAILVELHADAVGPVGPVVRTLRQRFPSAPLVVACTDKFTGRDLLHAARAGAENFAYLPEDDLGMMLAQLIAPSAALFALDTERVSLVDGLPRPISRVLEAALRAAGPPASVAAFAALLGVSTRTFERRGARHGWPAPSELLVWGRLVRGAAVVGITEEHPPAALARLLAASGFSTVDRASRAYARHAGVRLGTVMEAGMTALEPALRECFGSVRLNRATPVVAHSSAA